MLADHPHDLHDPRKTTIHDTNNDVDTPAANNERRTPDDKGGGSGGGEAINTGQHGIQHLLWQTGRPKGILRAGIYRSDMLWLFIEATLVIIRHKKLRSSA